MSEISCANCTQARKDICDKNFSFVRFMIEEDAESTIANGMLEVVTRSDGTYDFVARPADHELAMEAGRVLRTFRASKLIMNQFAIGCKLDEMEIEMKLVGESS